MKNQIRIINHTMELSDCLQDWQFNEEFNCWCLEDILYTPVPTTPAFQRLSIFVPAPYMSAPGRIDFDAAVRGYTARTVPVVFENNSAGYKQMPQIWLGGPRCMAEQYLQKGFVYISCGNRGIDSEDENGHPCGKAPANLVDLKTAIRFLRHNQTVLPGNYERIISVGWSAGGAMSALLGVTGDHERYTPYLREAGAFMDERDDVFAAQIYCPITDLENADLAYEWFFRADKENEPGPSAPAGIMTPFQEAVSKKLSDAFLLYFNGKKIKNPDGEGYLTLNSDGRSGSGYEYLMKDLNESATKYLKKLDKGELPEQYTVQDYLDGRYTFWREPPRVGNAHHAGEGADVRDDQEKTMGEQLLRPLSEEKRKPAPKPKMVEMRGTDKHSWLGWDGDKAEIAGLDAYVLNQRRRMKPCLAFDTFDCSSSENRVLAAPDEESTHFNSWMAEILESLKDEFPEEYAQYDQGFATVTEDEGLAEREKLMNPLNFIGTEENGRMARHFRIRTGASDGDTAFTVSMMLALKLMEAGIDTDYALVWEQPHSEADYEGEITDWIDHIVRAEEEKENGR